MKKKSLFKILLLVLSMVAAAFSASAQGNSNRHGQESGEVKDVQIKVRNDTTASFESIYILEEGKEPQWYSIHIPSVEEYKKLKKEQEKSSGKNTGKNNKSTDFLSPVPIQPEAYISLKTNTVYTVVLVDGNNNQYVKENIKIDPSNTNVMLDIKKNLKKKDFIEKFKEDYSRSVEQQKFETSVTVLMVGFLAFLLLLFLVGVFSALASGGKENLNKKLMGEDGSKMRMAEMIGALLMLVPVVVSLGSYHFMAEKTFFWFFKRTVERDVSIGVSITTMMFACAMYGIYIVRYGIFKIDSFLQIIFSVFQTLVNCWVLAGLCSIFVGGEVWNVPFINVSSKTFLILVVGLSLLGAKSVAGFAWILLIVMGMGRLTEVDSAMGVYGAIYIAFMFVGLLLQFIGLLKSTNFRNDFIGFAKKSGERIAGDVAASAQVTEKAVKTVASVAMAAAGVPGVPAVASVGVGDSSEPKSEPTESIPAPQPAESEPEHQMDLVDIARMEQD